MKKIVWSVLSAAIISFIVLSNDPLNDAVNFIISGTLPGTAISFGFWSTMVLAIVLIVLIRKAAKKTRHEMIVLETQRADKKNVNSELEESSNIVFDTSKRSVIAAGNSDLAI